MDIRQVVAFAKEGRYIGPEGITALASEVERLHKWADSFSDAQLEERATGERYQQELRAEIKKLTSQVETLTADNERLRGIVSALEDGCYSCKHPHDFDKGKAEGFREGVEAAAKVICGDELCKGPQCSECIVADIRSLAPSKG